MSGFENTTYKLGLNHRMRNHVIRERFGLKEDVETKIEKDVLRLFGEGENDSKVTKEMYKAKVEGNIRRERPCKTFSNSDSS